MANKDHAGIGAAFEIKVESWFKKHYKKTFSRKKTACALESRAQCLHYAF